jgi:polyisoprenoid-binding protein YceI
MVDWNQNHLRRGFGVLLLLISVIARGSAQVETFTVNPEQSAVGFSLGDVLHQVHGTFRIRSGIVQFNRGSSPMSGSIVVAAGSGKSGNDTRDHRMTVDILNAPQFTQATFSPTHLNGSIAATGDSTVEVDGVFILHGIPHDLTLPIRIHTDGKTCTAKAHVTIPYVKWGLKDPSTFLLRVNKDVDMEITLVGQLSTTTPR